MPEHKSIVVSHRKDADGLTSAALVRYMTNADVYLADYGDLIETLSQVGVANEYFICDVGVNKSTFGDFLKQLERFSQYGSVHYVDHHPLNEESESKLRKIGVDLIHSVEECTAVLVYRSFEEKLSNSPQMKIAACCGANTDYMDTRPFAKKLISCFDRQFLLYEATVLSFAISVIGRGSAESNAKLVDLTKDLSAGKLPHELDGASSYAQLHASRSATLLETAKKEGRRMKNFAYHVTKESATGNVANFLIGVFDVPVGVALREENDYYEVSLRSVDDSPHDLGKISGKVASMLNSAGGGHPHASGLSIKRSDLESFLEILDQELSQPV